PLLVAIDAEWGLAMRIENTPQYPYGITLGALPESDDDLIHLLGQHIAKDCLEAGIHWNLAPVVDINVNPENPVIGYRSFGENKEQVLMKAQAYIAGMQSLGILNAIKHFPGHGDTDMDSHLDLPVIAKSKEQLEAELFVALFISDHCFLALKIGRCTSTAVKKTNSTDIVLTNQFFCLLYFTFRIVDENCNHEKLPYLFLSRNGIQIMGPLLFFNCHLWNLFYHSPADSAKNEVQ
ncbi:MAG: glycoside hydrolase family 3 N-terminal domain-containing protein, partial [Bacteroidota bacterium]